MRLIKNIQNKIFLLLGRVLQKHIKSKLNKCHITIIGGKEAKEKVQYQSALITAWHKYIIPNEYLRSFFSEESIALAFDGPAGKIGAALGKYSSTIYLSPNKKNAPLSLVSTIKKLKKKKKFFCYIAPDGPCGPPHKAKPGAITIAKKMNIPIIPVSYAFSKYWAIPSWDQMIVPSSCSHIVISVGSPLYFQDMTIEEGVIYLENQLNDQEYMAKQHLAYLMK
jgi:hypothetical protein